MARGDYLRNNHRTTRSKPVVLPRPHARTNPVRNNPFENKIDLSDIWKNHDFADYSTRLPSLKQFLVGAGLVVATTGFVAFGYFSTNKNETFNPVQNNSTAKAGITQPNRSQPGFTTYFPSILPEPISVNRSSIRYANDSFNFTVDYSGNTAFFISEQVAADGFDLSYFNSRLSDIRRTSYFIGDAIIGKDGIDVKTAILTKDRTLIVINCDGSYYCTSYSDILARALQINTDSSLFDKPQ